MTCAKQYADHNFPIVRLNVTVRGTVTVAQDSKGGVHISGIREANLLHKVSSSVEFTQERDERTQKRTLGRMNI